MENFIGRNIKAFRDHKGFSQTEFAEATEISQSSDSAWESGSTLPSQANFDRLFEEFPELTHDDIFSAELGFANKALNRVSDERVAKVPMYGSISAGAPIEMIEADDEMPVPGVIFNQHPKSFLLRVAGDSMNRSLPNGCVVLVDPAAPFVDGKMYAVRVDATDATVKIVRRKNDGIELVPDSYDKRYAAKSYGVGENAAGQVEILGRVVWYCAPPEFGR